MIPVVKMVYSTMWNLNQEEGEGRVGVGRGQGGAGEQRENLQMEF